MNQHETNCWLHVWLFQDTYWPANDHKAIRYTSNHIDDPFQDRAAKTTIASFGSTMFHGVSPGTVEWWEWWPSIVDMTLLAQVVVQPIYTAGHYRQLANHHCHYEDNV